MRRSVFAVLIPFVCGGIAAALFASDVVFEQIMKFGITQFESNRVPDALSRWGTRQMLRQHLQDHEKSDGLEGTEQYATYVRNFINDLKSRPIAEDTPIANVQHYEVPTAFYDIVLGKRRKYSSALYPSPETPVNSAKDLLDDAEDRMLELYAQRARIASDDRLRVMDLGCGWGAVTLWFAERFPQCDFVGVSNSQTQHIHIMKEAASRGLTNVEVITGDINTLELPEDMPRFDRVISIEMMEHMKNYELLMQKIAKRFLKNGGLLFVHIFVARAYPYHFVVDGSSSDWMAAHFFRGGTMPSDDLLLHFQKDLFLVDKWNVDGRHYSLTLEAWLQNMDAHRDEIGEIFENVYGEGNIQLWIARWRAFFFVCSELFKYNEGREWFVSHYLFQAR